MPPALIVPMMIGAAVGAVSAAIQGGNILKGALFGAIGGGIGGAIAGAIGGAASGTAAGAAVGEAGGAVAGEAAGAVGAGSSMVGGSGAFLGEGVASGIGAWDGVAGGAMAGETAGAGAGAIAPAVGEVAAGTGVSQTLPTGLAEGSAGSQGWGVGNPVQAGVGTPGVDAGLAGTTPPNPFVNGTPDMSFGGQVLTPGQAQPRTFLESLFKDGSSMINSRMGVTMAGEALKGFAAGKAQEAQIAARRQDTADARANARFGTVGSRFNTASMVGPAGYK